ncbi:MAG: hypothetical protein LBF06_19805 [Pseudomonas sp.]|jgi:hypothetical protein|nr:hypothetical protein [Pseudomonas sp.]
MAVPQENLKLKYPVNDFIAEQLPGWLKQAKPAQIQVLRQHVALHLASQATVAQVAQRLLPLDGFAKGVLEHSLESRFGVVVDLGSAVWREVRTRVNRLGFEVLPGSTVPDIQPVTHDEPALQRLMRNFKAGQSFQAPTALLACQPIEGGAAQVVTERIDELVSLCREVDVGAAYQQHLEALLTASFEAVLATDKRLELALATEISALKGSLTPADVKTLREIGQGATAVHVGTLAVQAVGFEVLGMPVDGVLVFELIQPPRNQSEAQFGVVDRLKGIIAYLPDDHECPLRRFDDWHAMNLHLVGALRSADYLRAFERRLALKDRANVLVLLKTRLADDKPDLAPSSVVISQDVFKAFAARRVQRIKADARFLAVPTAEVDARTAAERLRALENAGLTVLGLAGMFVPVIGGLMLANLAVQMLDHVYEGARDWSQGHQHEALQHMLEVAASASVTALAGAAVWGLHAAHGAFVETLEPIMTEGGAPRLWRNDLAPYREASPTLPLTERDDGLFSNGQGAWWYRDGAYYKVKANSDGAWRLEHPGDPNAYGPLLRGNGERGWLLAFDRPLEWGGEPLLLTRLWPSARDLAPERVSQLLQVAGVDADFLRGVLVERRPLPVVLRDTLERFAVDARNEAFFQGVHQGRAEDAERLNWCVDRLALRSRPLAEQITTIRAATHSLREAMLDHFAELYLPQAPALAVLQRDFPGLPKAYALEVLKHADDDMRALMINRARLPLALAQRARAALQEARLARTREALFLHGSYRPDAMALVFALLRKHGLRAEQMNLALFEGSVSEQARVRLFPEGQGVAPAMQLVRSSGRFTVRDAQGNDRVVRQPQGLFEALEASLGQAFLNDQGWVGDDVPGQVRKQLQAWLPRQRTDVLALLGWGEAKAVASTMKRMADGRLGYPLGGSLSAFERPGQALRRRIRALYPSFDEDEVERFVQIVSNHGRSAMSNLLLQEQQYQQLEMHLQDWVQAAEEQQQHHRREITAALLRAWRFEGERVANAQGPGWGTRLSIMSVPGGGLPTLPVNIDFSNVLDLSLVDIRMHELPPGFLARFARLQRLNLSYNFLTALPDGLSALTHLRRLILRGNQIRIWSSQTGLPLTLTQLRILDLSGNSIRAASLPVGHLSQLRELGLQRTGLTALPAGLERCEQLVYADLRHNRIRQLPASWGSRPLAWRNAVDLRGNALALLPGNVTPPAAAGAESIGGDALRALWLATVEPAEQTARQLQWNRLRGLARATSFFSLLQEMAETSDFRAFPAYTGERVWSLVEAASSDEVVRDELFERAADPRTCRDNASEVFSQLVVRMHVARMRQRGAPLATRTDRLELAQRLYRLDRVAAIVRADIEDRYESGEWQREDTNEEVEVDMAYLSGLAVRLDLLGQPRSMLFQSLAGVTQAQIDAAYTQVLNAEATPARVASISQRDFWLEYLRQRYEEPFGKIEDAFIDKLQTLESEKPTLNSAEYVARSGELAVAREQALQALALRLTREEMGLAGQAD